jgi:hypothetical protein
MNIVTPMRQPRAAAATLLSFSAKSSSGEAPGPTKSLFARERANSDLLHNESAAEAVQEDVGCEHLGIPHPQGGPGIT